MTHTAPYEGKKEKWAEDTSTCLDVTLAVGKFLLTSFTYFTNRFFYTDYAT